MEVLILPLPFIAVSNDLFRDPAAVDSK
jgi:hypothetical protein